MTSALIVLNNYFHDLTIALVSLSGLAAFLMARSAERNGKELSGLFNFIYPKLKMVAAYSAVFLVAAGIVRAWSLSEFEWGDAVRNNQLVGLKAKFIMLTALFVLGLYFWIVTIAKARKQRQ